MKTDRVLHSYAGSLVEGNKAICAIAKARQDRWRRRQNSLRNAAGGIFPQAVRYLVGCGCVFLTLLGSGCDRKPNNPAASATAKAAPPSASVYAYGIVEARRHSTLSAKFPGKIARILVREGEPVKEGQLLAQFEARELIAQVGVAKAAAVVGQAALAEAEAGARPREIAAAAEALRDAEAQLTKSNADWQRFQRLRLEGVVSASDWEQVQQRRDSSLARYNVAAQQLHQLQEGTRPEAITLLRRKLELARAEIARAEAALADARLTAPYAGVITRKHREEGEALDIGLPVLDIATLDDRYVRAEIDETDIGRLKLGQPAQVSADGFPGLEFAGKVVEVKQQMGPKKLIPTDPSKIVDYKVLDVEVSLPAACPYPIKLPVNVRIGLQ
ncbi:MAG: HlyD family efflux transporter periplasmic adaptor subunit [Desulfobulbaceae bacterium]|nr:HlyD family efflux transporter periplasmic adaptor subunit [Desulfobulbaceae bacterium]